MKLNDYIALTEKIILNENEKEVIYQNVINKKPKRKRTAILISAMLSVLFVFSALTASYISWYNDVITSGYQSYSGAVNSVVPFWPKEVDKKYKNGMSIDLAKYLINLKDSQFLRVKFYYYNQELINQPENQEIINELNEYAKLNSENKRLDQEMLKKRDEFMLKIYDETFEYLSAKNIRGLTKNHVYTEGYCYSAIFTKKEMFKKIEQDENYYFSYITYKEIKGEYDFSKISQHTTYLIENLDPEEIIKVYYILEGFDYLPDDTNDIRLEKYDRAKEYYLEYLYDGKDGKVEGYHGVDELYYYINGNIYKYTSEEEWEKIRDVYNFYNYSCNHLTFKKEIQIKDIAKMLEDERIVCIFSEYHILKAVPSKPLNE